MRDLGIISAGAGRFAVMGPRILLAIGAVVCCLAGPALAGTKPQLKQGDRVWIRTQETNSQYILQEIRSDTLFVLADPGARPAAIPVAQVERIEVRVRNSSGSGVWKGALIGGAVGGTIGMVYAFASWDDSDADCGPDPIDDFCDTSIGAWRVMGYTFVFGAPAMLLGAVIGGSSAGEHWEAVDLPGPVGLGAGTDGTVVLKYTIAF